MSASATQGGRKNGDAQKKRSGRKVRGVSPEAGRESIIIILFVLNQTTQHMTAMQMNRTNKAQRALIVALNA